MPSPRVLRQFGAPAPGSERSWSGRSSRPVAIGLRTAVATESGARTPYPAGMEIDIAFDFRTDAGGKDPDSHSRTLRRYHRLLWSKPLPSGAPFDLSDTTPRAYLHHRSTLGEFSLSSDSAIPTFTRWVSLKPITGQFPESENEAFRTIGYTIGGMMVFPGNRIGRKMTINGARGFKRQIADRFDLTLECIRRHYLAHRSPLADTLSLYASFFALFDDFRGYVRFFLLEDLVTSDFGGVRFFMPFDDFRSAAVPRDVDSYAEYRRRSIDFIEARNRRIQLFGEESEIPAVVQSRLVASADRSRSDDRGGR